jgi:hypothetical protein
MKKVHNPSSLNPCRVKTHDGKRNITFNPFSKTQRNPYNCLFFSLKLTHHHNIQRSTLRLRELAKPRDVDNSPSHPGSEDPTRPAHAHGDYEK